MTSLPGLNVWQVLAVDTHPHHIEVKTWFEENADPLVFVELP